MNISAMDHQNTATESQKNKHKEYAGIIVEKFRNLYNKCNQNAETQKSGVTCEEIYDIFEIKDGAEDWLPYDIFERFYKSIKYGYDKDIVMSDLALDVWIKKMLGLTEDQEKIILLLELLDEDKNIHWIPGEIKQKETLTAKQYIERALK